MSIPPDYLDRYGLLHKKHGERTGNGLSHLAWYTQGQALMGRSIPPLQLIMAVNTCLVDDASGDPLINRAPDDASLQSHDDYVHIFCAFLQAGVNWNGPWVYGQSHRWSFNNVNPGKWTFESWMGRFPHFPVLAKLAATGTLNWAEGLILHAVLRHGLHRAKRPGGSWIGPLTLSYACSRALPEPFLAINRRIVKECREAHSDGLVGPFADYFLQDREHPVVKAWQMVEDFEAILNGQEKKS